MLRRFLLNRLNKKIAVTHLQIANVAKMIQEGKYTRVNGEYRCYVLRIKLSNLIQKESKMKSKLPRKFSNKMFRWLCLYALVVIVIAFLAGCNPVTASDSTGMGNNINFSRDYVNGNVCYTYLQSAISCVPMRE